MTVGGGLMVYSHWLTLGPDLKNITEDRNRDRKNGLYEIVQNVSHYTGTRT